MDFTRINFTNVYRGLDNVVLVIWPRSSSCRPRSGSSSTDDGTADSSDIDSGLPSSGKGLLIASHYDSAVCSTGAFRFSMKELSIYAFKSFSSYHFD